MAGRLALPALDWLPGYRKEWLRLDLLAGLVTAAVVIPKAMAYATIAGLPVQVGLYTALVPMAIYAVLGTSRPLSVSTTTTIAILTGAQLGEIAPDGDPASLMRAAATLSVVVGGILLLASLLRLGFVANFISEPVLIGFKAGIGLVIVLDQIPKLMGIHFPKTGVLSQSGGDRSRTFPKRLFRRFSSVSPRSFSWSVWSTFCRARRRRSSSSPPESRRWVSSACRLSVSRPSATIPPRPAVPDDARSLALVARLWPAALGIALMSFTETIAAARAFARTDEPPLRANRELLATGFANAVGGLFASMPSGGGTSQTAVNRRAGARTQLAGARDRGSDAA